MNKQRAAECIQVWARMNFARAAYKIAAAEAKEQAKMENQLAALQRRLEDEAIARTKMEEENAALQERLLSVRRTPYASRKVPILLIEFALRRGHFFISV